ncbi:hypothetical protein P171DRAFT_525680 [Karstenula rhodostoma CBS 690.94]|uniref:Uncharacterized protein n=1 Tax=Karstenula rhodostoma CBS 690.94 TaxID=1392251 RepID=A0A9P4P7Z1_9PLEO|nr:hypothetical protein P171DRAFT_525680 [Karstenula rhodostoma CBS 690.94]
MTSEYLDDGIISLPWTPTSSDLDELRDAIPQMDADFDTRKQIEQVEVSVNKANRELNDKISEMRQSFDKTQKQTNDYLIVVANHVQELHNRIEEQKQEIDSLHRRLIKFDEWKQVTSDWTYSIMRFLFGDEVMNDAPEVNDFEG